MSEAKEKTPQIIVVGNGLPKRPAVKIVTSPSKPKFIALGGGTRPAAR